MQSDNHRKVVTDKYKQLSINTQNVSPVHDTSLIYLFLKTGITFDDIQMKVLLQLDVSDEDHEKCYNRLLEHVKVSASSLAKHSSNRPLIEYPLTQIWSLCDSIAHYFRGMFMIPSYKSFPEDEEHHTMHELRAANNRFCWKNKYYGLWALVVLFNREYEIASSANLEYSEVYGNDYTKMFC